MYSAAIELCINCPKCETIIIINGPSAYAHCNACQNDTPLTAAFWKDLFQDVLETVVTELKDGEDQTWTSLGKFYRKITFTKSKPFCSECKNISIYQRLIPKRNQR